MTRINPEIQEPVRSDAASDGAGARRSAALVTNGLSKRYGRRLAVDALSIEVPAGVVAGFIGPNGAGKTTTMAMLLGLVRPTAGTATVLGASVEHPASYLGPVGALIEAPSFWPGLSGVENLRVPSTLGGHDTGRIPEVLDRRDDVRPARHHRIAQPWCPRRVRRRRASRWRPHLRRR